LGGEKQVLPAYRKKASSYRGLAYRREASSYRGLLYRVFSLLPSFFGVQLLFLAYSPLLCRAPAFSLPRAPFSLLRARPFPARHFHSAARQPFLYRARPIFSPARAIFSPFPARHFPARAPSSPTRPPGLLGARNRCGIAARRRLGAPNA
jgi:hypothetical protein